MDLLIGHVLAMYRLEADGFAMAAKENSKKFTVPAYGFALFMWDWAIRGQALQWLEKIYQDRVFEALYFKVDPFLDPMRDDSRFKAVLKRMNLPE